MPPSRSTPAVLWSPTLTIGVSWTGFLVHGHLWETRAVGRLIPVKEGDMGGQDAIRGFVVQALSGLLSALVDEGEWDTLEIEPNEADEKVDIRWGQSQAVGLNRSSPRGMRSGFPK